MCRERKRVKTLVSAAAHPEVIETIKTYSWASGHPVEIIPTTDGATDLAALEAMLGDDTACVYIAQPNYFGIIEDTAKAGEIIKKAGAKFIMGVNPIAAALLKTPAECGADIAVGDGQPLGMPLSFGGPYLGFMAATTAMTRKLPGRIVGETLDADGSRAFVLTLQAREQHIRREKASSNICSNQALCAMTAAAYMAAMGPEGMKQAATQSMSKARYLAEQLGKLDGLGLVYNKLFFHEFVTQRPADTDKIMAHLEKHGVLGGLPIDGGILWCATEMNTKEDMDRMIALVKEARA
jgi:glycine dehydrogenase subunit 1